MNLPLLPIHASLEELKIALRNHSGAVLQAPPGSGKSTIVPLALLNEQWLRGKSILLLQPRRVAVRGIASRMSELLQESVGETVGLRIRFESRVSEKTRVEVITEGILTRRLQQDPELRGVGLVIFDEFHERSLHADLSLALALASQEAFRPDLKLLVMSATIAVDPVSRLLGNAPVIQGRGVPFPVEISYCLVDSREPLAKKIADLIRSIVPTTEGDILVFLPGVPEIRQCEKELMELSALGLEIQLLYGDLPAKDQAKILFAGKTRRVILSTPIAETSVTIDGVRVVIDSGFQKKPRFEPCYGTNRLVLERISQDSAEQRAGRAGRVGPGRCFRMWTPHLHESLRKVKTPEIQEADLAHFLLELAAWGEHDVRSLKFLDYPSESSLLAARETLLALGAIDENYRITKHGDALSRISAPVRLANLLLAGVRFGVSELAADLAALLDERDLLGHEGNVEADIETRLQLLQDYRQRKRVQADSALLRRVHQVSEEWLRSLKVEKQAKQVAVSENSPSVGLLIASAFPERIAKRRLADEATEGKGARYLLALGNGGQLRLHDKLSKENFLAVAHFQLAKQGDGRIQLAARLCESDIHEHFGAFIKEEEILSWSTKERAVVAESQSRLGSIVLSRKLLEKVSPERMAQEFLKGVRISGGVSILPWTEGARQFQGRVRWYRQLVGDSKQDQVADTSDQALEERLESWLLPYLLGKSKLRELESLPLLEILRAMFSWEQLKKIDEELPSSFQGPDGRTRAIDYSSQKTPVLSATVQELLGWYETPQLAGGQVPLLFEILSPARRAIQLTSDLAGFWQGSYQLVKKDLKGRYPKHAWPEDPLRYIPTRVREKRS